MSSKGNLHNAEYQTDSLVYNIETVSLSCQITHKFSFPKYVNHKYLIVIPPTAGGQVIKFYNTKYLR